MVSSSRAAIRDRVRSHVQPMIAPAVSRTPHATITTMTATDAAPTVCNRASDSPAPNRPRAFCTTPGPAVLNDGSVGT